ncbi:MAG: hypothetical protein AAF108_08910 [Planctomycetota bacterium]
MNDLTKLLLASTIAGALALGGCGNESGTPDTDSHSEHDDHEGHDHGEDGHDDHEGHDHGDGGHDDHGAEHDLGSVTIAGTTLSISMGGEVEPTAVLHLDIVRTDGPEPAAIRVWIGDEAATGALKGRATGSGGDYHADTEVPAELTPDAALWIEIEKADGSRETGSISLE